MSKSFYLAAHPAFLETMRTKLRKHPWDKRPLDELLNANMEEVKKLCNYYPTAAPPLTLTVRNEPVYAVRDDKESEVDAKYYPGRHQALFNLKKFSGSVLAHEIGHFFCDLIHQRKEVIPQAMQEMVCQYLDLKID